MGTTTVRNWKRLKAETGQLVGSGRPPTPYKIDSDKLRAYVKEQSDAFLKKITLHLNVTPPAIHAALNRLKITRKKVDFI